MFLSTYITPFLDSSESGSDLAGAIRAREVLARWYSRAHNSIWRRSKQPKMVQHLLPRPSPNCRPMIHALLMKSPPYPRTWLESNAGKTGNVFFYLTLRTRKTTFTRQCPTEQKKGSSAGCICTPQRLAVASPPRRMISLRVKTQKRPMSVSNVPDPVRSLAFNSWARGRFFGGPGRCRSSRARTGIFCGRVEP